MRAVGARRVVLIHWDDFFRPLHKPLRALPYAGDDLDVSMRVLSRLAEEDGIPLHLPRCGRPLIRGRSSVAQQTRSTRHAEDLGALRLLARENQPLR